MLNMSQHNVGNLFYIVFDNLIPKKNIHIILNIYQKLAYENLQIVTISKDML